MSPELRSAPSSSNDRPNAPQTEATGASNDRVSLISARSLPTCLHLDHHKQPHYIFRRGRERCPSIHSGCQSLHSRTTLSIRLQVCLTIQLPTRVYGLSGLSLGVAMKLQGALHALPSARTGAADVRLPIECRWLVEGSQWTSRTQGSPLRNRSALNRNIRPPGPTTLLSPMSLA